MSWDEYNSLFYPAQETGKFHLFVFDIKESRKGYDYLVIQKFINAIYNRLEELEIQKHIKIIHIPIEEARGNVTGILGDLFFIVIIRDSLEAQDIYKVVAEEKVKLNISYKFHYDDAFYETDDWVLGDKMYYREYAIPFLEERSKTKKDTL